MNKELKQALLSEFEAPKAKKKEAFLRNIRQSQISDKQFLFIQMSYIRKRVWVVSIFLFAVAWYGAFFLRDTIVWLLSAVTPFLAVIFVTEKIRSEVYGMSELEMTTRFSLKSITLARMCILGLFHAILMGIIVVLGGISQTLNVLHTSVYLLVPYLLTGIISMKITRKVQGNEATYACCGIAVFIGLIPAIGGNVTNFLFKPQVFIWWLIVFMILCIEVFIEYRRTIKETEVFKWNW